MRISFTKLLNKFRNDDRGVTLVEYGIALALAVFVGSTALVSLGGAVDTQMGAAEAAM